MSNIVYSVESSESSRISWNQVESLVVEGEQRHPYVIDAIRKLSEIVCNSHFNYCSDTTKEDLRQEGVYKALELMRQGAFRTGRGSIKNYFYSGMRNQMQNLLQKTRKEIPVPEHFDVGGSVDESWEVVDIPWDEIVSFFAGRDSAYHKYLPVTVGALSEMGFQIKGVPQGIDIPEPVDPVVAGVSACILKKLVCLIVWDRVERANVCG